MALFGGPGLFSRYVSPGLRRQVFARDRGICQRCGGLLDERTFHCAHLRPHSDGGPPILDNLQAWCAPCNLTWGNKTVVDTRAGMILRDWQEEALLIALERLAADRVTTIMAAPGAGKTLFAATVFREGFHAGLWKRAVILVPRFTLVRQWKESWESTHIALDIEEAAQASGIEIRGMHGVAATYQRLLTDSTCDRFARAAEQEDTLLILDEVHHLGEPAGGGNPAAGWSKAVCRFAGDVRTRIRVRGVLNLSGTLFRTSLRERISTVHYRDVDAEHIEALADYKITSEQLVRDRLLRAPDLWRVGATIEHVDLRDGMVSTNAIADLNADAARGLLTKINTNPAWIPAFVRVVLDELEKRYRDLGKAPLKALIVTPFQPIAKQYADEVNRQMRQRGLIPFAESVVSDDGTDGYRRLHAFRTSRQPGVLCTVGMAGEGFDCPEICVIGYATRILTPLYVRQVLARGQRVCETERQRGKRLTVAVVVPDHDVILDVFREVLTPMVHVAETTAPSVASQTPRPPGSGSTDPRHILQIDDAGVDVVTPVCEASADVPIEEVQFFEELAPKYDLFQSDAPRIALLVRDAAKQHPFDVPQPVTMTSRTLFDPPRPMTAREENDIKRKPFNELSAWVAHFGKPTLAVDKFTASVKREARIDDLRMASGKQLDLAWTIGAGIIRRHCAETGKPLPKSLRAPE
jgi:hypothetical protein